MFQSQCVLQRSLTGMPQGSLVVRHVSTRSPAFRVAKKVFVNANMAELIGEARSVESGIPKLHGLPEVCWERSSFESLILLKKKL